MPWEPVRRAARFQGKAVSASPRYLELFGIHMVKEKERDEEIRLVLHELRRMIKRSEYSQRQVEELAGFSKGYLSQLLARNLDLKVWHVLAILDVFQVGPSEFFERLYPGAGRAAALESFSERSEPLVDDLDKALSTLYRVGVESLGQLRERLEACERAVAVLEEKGLLSAGKTGK